jgi:NAD dependent epimerase/dehydratase family enzyme
LSRLRLPFKLGLGGPLGDGRQWMPWVHIDDQVALIDFLLQHKEASGPYNACAPEPVRNREFARRWACPASAGVAADAGLAAQGRAGRVVDLAAGRPARPPVRLLAAGFTFRFNDLQSALDNLSSRL